MFINKLAVIGTSAARKNTWKGNEIESCRPSEFLLVLKQHNFIVAVVAQRKLQEIDLAWTHLADHIFFPIGKQTSQDAKDLSIIRAYQMMFREFGFVEPIISRKKTWLDYQTSACRQGAVGSMHALNMFLARS